MNQIGFKICLKKNDYRKQKTGIYSTIIQACAFKMLLKFSITKKLDGIWDNINKKIPILSWFVMRNNPSQQRDGGRTVGSGRAAAIVLFLLTIGFVSARIISFQKYGGWINQQILVTLQGCDGLYFRMNRNRDYGIPVPDYGDRNVSSKIVKIIQSYTGIVDRFVWRKA